jgi:hypothetical protein
VTFFDKQILLTSPFGHGSGYGADGVALAQLLEQRGAHVHLDPTAVNVPLPMDVAKMLARPRPDRFDLMLSHLDIGALKMGAHVPDSGRVNRTLAWTMWEFGGVGGEECEPRLRENLVGFDSFLGYTQTTVDSIKPYLADNVQTGVIMGGYDADLWKPNPELDPVRDWDRTFKFGMVVTNQRKNWPIALAAFLALKYELRNEFDAELHIKSNGLFVPPVIHDPSMGVHVHHEGWTHTKMRAFYAQLNCLVCPSWGEGKSLPPMEAGTLGCPSILSKCPGHVDWASESIAFMVGGETRQRVPGQTAFYVDGQELEALMLRVYSERFETRMRGEAAAQVIPQMCDWSRVMERLDLWMEDTPVRGRPVAIPEVAPA